MIGLIRIGLLLVVLAAPARAETASLSDLIAERLSLMRPVAAWKVENDRPVEDLAREVVVLDEATAQAVERGLDPPGIRVFFKRQIEAAKEIQHCWISRWSETGQPGQPIPDLLTEIRPELLRLGDAIIDAMARDLQKSGQLQADPEVFDIECLPPQTARALSAALSEVRATGN